MALLDYTSSDTVRDSYRTSGREEKDRRFRDYVTCCGPTERRWLGWGGARVLVVGMRYNDFFGELCPTPWSYLFRGLRSSPNDRVLESSEINFCDDEDVEALCHSWMRTEAHLQSLRDDIASAYVPLYCI